MVSGDFSSFIPPVKDIEVFDALENAITGVGAVTEPPQDWDTVDRVSTPKTLPRKGEGFYASYSYSEGNHERTFLGGKGFYLDMRFILFDACDSTPLETEDIPTVPDYL